MPRDTWRVVAYLDTPLAGVPPLLDAVLLSRRLRVMSWLRRLEVEADQWRLDQLPLPVVRNAICDTPNIPRASCALYGTEALEGDWLLEAAANPLKYDAERVTVLTWFAAGSGEGLADMLGDVVRLGPQHTSDSGAVGRWVVERWPHDWGWFASIGSDRPQAGKEASLLMRPLPEPDRQRVRCSGARRTIGPVKPPYGTAEQVRCVVPRWMAAPDVLVE